jgi:hypothetical protein
LAPQNKIFGAGDVPSALTDVRDVGIYAAKIISDPRTLNKKVFAFTDTLTQNQLFGLVESMSGEKLEITKVEKHIPYKIALPCDRRLTMSIHRFLQPRLRPRLLRQGSLVLASTKRWPNTSTIIRGVFVVIILQSVLDT